jgi:hypothetical protein
MLIFNQNTRRQLLTTAAAGVAALGLQGRPQAKMATGLPQAPR